MNRRLILRSAAATTVASLMMPARAQAYPARPIRIVCPYPPGATTDTLSRLMSASLQAETGATVVVDNRGGAGGNIGTEQVARGEADGYTVLLGALGPLAANQALYARLGFDPIKDFTPLALAASVPLVLVAHPSFPAKSLAETVTLLRSKPGAFTYASAGNGTPQHLAAEMFKRESKTAIDHVPYRGSAPAVTDVVGGQVPLLFEAATAVLQHIASGRLRAIAVTSGERTAALPEIPTLKEGGIDAQISGWYGFLAPVATPPDRVRWLRENMGKVLATEPMRKRLAELGSLPVESSPDAFAELIRSEQGRWGELIRSAGIKLD